MGTTGLRIGRGAGGRRFRNLAARRGADGSGQALTEEECWEHRRCWDLATGGGAPGSHRRGMCLGRSEGSPNRKEFHDLTTGGGAWAASRAHRWGSAEISPLGEEELGRHRREEELEQH
jgi:hypothetical protein